MVTKFLWTISCIYQLPLSATNKIEEKIKNIQVAGGDVSGIIGEVTTFISAINDAVSGINEIAVQQNQMAEAISGNVTDTVKGTQRVADSITQMNRNSKEIADGAREAAARAQSVHASMEAFTQEATHASKNAHHTQKASADVDGISNQLTGAIGKYKI